LRVAATGALRDLTSMRPHGAQPEREDYSESNYDEWSGYGGSLFATGSKPSIAGGFMGVDDAEDNEADMVFNKVDEFMDGRRKKKREEKVKQVQEELKKDKQKTADYQAQFADLKKQLASISRNEWESLPDAPDLVKLSKRQRE
jgi:pre-mRNA-processing factor 6